MKDYKQLRIVFFGTPDFAVTSLEALMNEGCQVLAVVTAPGKPAGRGLQLKQSDVYHCASQYGLPILQPEKLKNPEFLKTLKSYNADLFVVIAFRMLPEKVWNMPPMGTINVHASLLPNYRGAAPINHAIINGEIETGVTTFRLKHEIDTGNILMQERVAIFDTDNAGTLYNKLKVEGARLLLQTIQGLADGSITPRPQAEYTDRTPHAPKLNKAMGQIDWQQPAVNVLNLIRGLAPYPAAYTYLDSKTLKITEATILAEKPDTPAGQYKTDGKTYLRFAANDAYIDIHQLQLEGKKSMDTATFLRGYRFN